METKGYHSYSGRGKPKKIWLIVVLVLILLAAAAFLLLQPYVVYDADGGIRLDLPFFQKKEQQPLPEVEETIQKEDPSEQPVKKPEPDPDPEPAPAPMQDLTEIHAAELPYDCLTEDPAGLLEGQSAVVVPLKHEDGSLAYRSSLSLPEGVLQGGEDTTANLKVITDSDCYTIARISTLCDNAYAMGQPESAICYSGGGLWYDNFGRNWLDGGQEATRDYLCGLAKECQEMGFDELLLEQFRYPIEGNLGQTSLADDADRAGTLAQLAAAIKEAAPGVRISILLTGSIGTDRSFAESGLPVEVLTENFDRIYVPQASGAYYWLDGVLDEEFDRASRLVIVDTVPVSGGSYLTIQ